MTVKIKPGRLAFMDPRWDELTPHWPGPNLEIIQDRAIGEDCPRVVVIKADAEGKSEHLVPPWQRQALAAIENREDPMTEHLQSLPAVSVHVQSRVTLSAATRLTNFNQACQVLGLLSTFGHKVNIRTFHTHPDLSPDEYVLQFQDGRFVEIITQGEPTRKLGANERR